MAVCKRRKYLLNQRYRGQAPSRIGSWVVVLL